MSHWSNSLPELSDKQIEFIEWLVDPERKGSQAQWARDHHLDPHTVVDWKYRDPRFRRGLQKRLDELNINPDRVQDILNNLHKLAKGQGREAVAAAKAYLQYVERLEPARKPIEDRAIKDLTQEELLQQLEVAVDSQRRKQIKAVNE